MMDSWGYAVANSLLQLSDEATKIGPLRGDQPNDVVFDSKYGLRTVLLNRPEKLNSLDGSMIRKIAPRLIEWEKSDLANVIVLKGAGEKALCAGGDVAALAKNNKKGAEGWKKSAEYFALEYKLDHYIATYKKPYIAFMDGITMGGGVGLSLHAPFRIATERTVFAMPETTIGFFPDVGASFFLPRLNGSIGTYLALTSDRVTGPNVFYTGIATHYIHSASLPDLEARLAELRFKDYEPLAVRLDLINATLEEFCTGLPYDQPMELAGEKRKAIDRCFQGNSVETILEALNQETGETKQWAQKTIETLKRRSPTSVRVALKQMRESQRWDIAHTFQREYQMAAKFMQHPDFTTGVTSLLVEKSKERPRWEPAHLSNKAAHINNFFEFNTSEQLELFDDRTYEEYPHGSLGVPTEKEIEALVSQKSDATPDELAREVIASRNGRQGVSEVVHEILGRKTTVNADGKVQWIPTKTTTTTPGKL